MFGIFKLFVNYTKYRVDNFAIFEDEFEDGVVSWGSFE